MADKRESDESRRKALASLQPEEQQIFHQLRDDYLDACKEHLKLNGGMPFAVAAELVLSGWRKAK